MNQAHLHLLINHFPIIGSYISSLVLLSGYLIRNQSVRNIGLSLVIFSALCAIPAYLTGDGAEDILKASRQANEKFIEKHEEAAEGAIWFFEITGLIALIAFIASIQNLRYSRALTAVATICSIAVSVAMMKVGNSGGEIRHTEIRSTNAPTNGAESHEDH